MPLSVESVQAFLNDKSAQANLFSSDIDFSPAEIQMAMKLTAGAYNSTLPPCDTVSVACMPDIDEDDTFVHGVAAALLRSMMMNIARNAIEYTAGGVTVSKDSQIYAFYEKLEPQLRAYFERGAKSRKMVKNVRMAYGQIG